MTKDEALRMALEELEGCYITFHEDEDIAETITAIKEALQSNEQVEPVAWHDSKTGWTDFHSFKPVRKPSAPDAEWIPLYTHPPVPTAQPEQEPVNIGRELKMDFAAENDKRLAQQSNEQVEEPKPMAWQWLNTSHFRKKLPKDAEKGAWNPLFTHPPVPTAQPEQETNKNGSPCPEFWDWLPKAYNFEGDGNFTKYNMEVAFLAGKQAAQPKEPEQEPVAVLRVITPPDPFIHEGKPVREIGIDYDDKVLKFVDGIYDLYTSPPKRKPLTDEDCTHIYNDANGIITKNPPITTERIFKAMRAAHGIIKE